LLVTAIILGTAVMVGSSASVRSATGERELEKYRAAAHPHFDQQFDDSNFIVNNLISQMQISESLRRSCQEPDVDSRRPP